MERTRFAFGPFLLDGGRETLYEHGVPVAIGRKAFALLRALVEARGDVVTKAELMEAAWPDISVEESNLAVQIAALRRRLGTSPDNEDWIVTFPRIGYRFGGPLEVEVSKSPGHTPTAVSSAASGHRGINMQAYDFYVRGRSLCLQSPSGNKLARSYFVRAIGLEPTFAQAHAWLACSHFGAALNYGEAVDDNRALGHAFARTAVALDPDDPVAHWTLGYVNLYEGKVDEAQSEWEKALQIEPDHADILAKIADPMVLQGQPDEAIALVEKALSLNPCPPGWYFWNLGFAYYAVGRYAEAAEILDREELGRLPAKRILAASLAQLGQLDKARLEAERFLEINPGFKSSVWAATQPFRNKADGEHFVDGYIKAGLPR
jgi:DNA-binding winged helix-turn-helix (wHTH) protein/Flp pilus assembly protein TadD